MLQRGGQLGAGKWLIQKFYILRFEPISMVLRWGIAGHTQQADARTSAQPLLDNGDPIDSTRQNEVRQKKIDRCWRHEQVDSLDSARRRANIVTEFLEVCFRHCANVRIVLDQEYNFLMVRDNPRFAWWNVRREFG